jgi:hypothetical protein
VPGKEWKTHQQIIIIIIIIINRVEEKRREWLVINYLPAEMALVDTGPANYISFKLDSPAHIVWLSPAL